MTDTPKLPITGQWVAEQCAFQYANNVAAGWFTDPVTKKPIERNFGEMLMLIVTELSEAADGVTRNRMGEVFFEPDDKLPHRDMVDVELVDTAIRLFELIGYTESDADFIRVAFDLDHSKTHDRIDNSKSLGDELMVIIGSLSKAMEAHRKSRPDERTIHLLDALNAVFRVSYLHRYDIVTTIAEKREFNANRADHKLENRAMDGGKKV